MKLNRLGRGTWEGSIEETRVLLWYDEGGGGELRTEESMKETKK